MSDITFKHHDPNVMLELWHVTKRFGGLTAVGDVSFKIKKGEIYALIGPNGAGKTTIFNLITGVYALTEGRVIFRRYGRRAGRRHHQGRYARNGCQALPQAALRHHVPRHGAHVPEHPPVQERNGLQQRSHCVPRGGGLQHLPVALAPQGRSQMADEVLLPGKGSARKD